MGAIVASATQLRCLIASDCPFLSDTLLDIISKSPIRNCLRILDVSKCPKITNIGLKSLATRCTKLSVLNIGYCDDITSEFMEDLGKNEILLKELKELYITENNFEYLPDTFVKNATSLQRLYASCNKITEFPVNLEHMKSLKYLYLYNNQVINI